VTIREAEDSIRRQSYETAIAWNKQGQQIFRKEGEQYQVVFGDDDLVLLNSAVLTHNHPRGLEFPKDDKRSWGNSFSDADLQLACVAQLSELRVVTPRLRFSLKPSSSGWDEAYWTNLLAPSYLYHEGAVAQESVAAFDSGSLSAEDAESCFFHEVCLRVSRDLGLIYTREES